MKRKRGLKLIERQMQGADPVHTPPKPEDMSCFVCKHEETCEYAWDLYNTGGDCLASK